MFDIIERLRSAKWPYVDKHYRDLVNDAADEIARLREVIRQIDMTLRVPAAEYVPAIGDVFTIIDAAGLRHDVETRREN